MTVRKFDFGRFAHQGTFDAHKEASIPGYGSLAEAVTGLALRFVQDGTIALDVGCSTGELISAIRIVNHKAGRQASYQGWDIEPKFAQSWAERTEQDLMFANCDVCTGEFANTSFVTSLFTLQFLSERWKMPVLRNIHGGLVAGGALVVAEKILASTGRLQDALTFPYYDFKRQHFTPKQILDKELSLRGQMTLWTEAELRSALVEVGFREIEPIWGSFPFAAFVALK